MAKHPHDAEIRAWLDGKAVQNRRKGFAVWCDVPSHAENIRCAPLFTPDFEYRIKPETIRYRVALMERTANKPLPIAIESDSYKVTEAHPKFIRWLGDEQEVEVTP